MEETTPRRWKVVDIRPPSQHLIIYLTKPLDLEEAVTYYDPRRRAISHSMVVGPARFA